MQSVWLTIHGIQHESHDLVANAGCDYASVEQVNRDTVNPLLSKLVQMPFMRYFKVSHTLHLEP